MGFLNYILLILFIFSGTALGSRSSDGSSGKDLTPQTMYMILRPLSKLTKLEKLALTHCQIKDISPIRNLERLEYLNLSHNRITDFSAVEKLSQLKELIKAGNPR